MTWTTYQVILSYETSTIPVRDALMAVKKRASIDLNHTKRFQQIASRAISDRHLFGSAAAQPLGAGFRDHNIFLMHHALAGTKFHARL